MAVHSSPPDKRLSCGGYRHARSPLDQLLLTSSSENAACVSSSFTCITPCSRRLISRNAHLHERRSFFFPRCGHASRGCSRSDRPNFVTVSRICFEPAANTDSTRGHMHFHPAQSSFNGSYSQRRVFCAHPPSRRNPIFTIINTRLSPCPPLRSMSRCR